MKRTLFSLLTVVVLAGLTGCITQYGRRPWSRMGGSCAQAPENGQACDDPGDNCNDPKGCGHCARCCRRAQCVEEANPGPPAPTVTYPYYTTRGPRDFLANNPPSIGP